MTQIIFRRSKEDLKDQQRINFSSKFFTFSFNVRLSSERKRMITVILLLDVE